MLQVDFGENTNEIVTDDTKQIFTRSSEGENVQDLDSDSDSDDFEDKYEEVTLMMPALPKQHIKYSRERRERLV